jgi:hypothetical protein
VGHGYPVLDELPGRVVKLKLLSVEGEIRLQHSLPAFSPNFQETSVSHREDIETRDRPIRRTDLGQGDPLVAGGLRPVRLHNVSSCAH